MRFGRSTSSPLCTMTATANHTAPMSSNGRTHTILGQKGPLATKKPSDMRTVPITKSSIAGRNAPAIGTSDACRVSNENPTTAPSRCLNGHPPLFHARLDEAASRPLDPFGRPERLHMRDAALIPHIIGELGDVLSQVDGITREQNLIEASDGIDHDHHRWPKNVVIPRHCPESLLLMQLKRFMDRIQFSRVHGDRGRRFPGAVVTPAVVSFAVLTPAVAMAQGRHRKGPGPRDCTNARTNGRQ